MVIEMYAKFGGCGELFGDAGENESRVFTCQDSHRIRENVTWTFSTVQPYYAGLLRRIRRNLKEVCVVEYSSHYA